MAFMSVDLPAPLVPMRPTTSPSPTSIETSSTATLPPKRTTTSSARSTGTPCGQRRALRRPCAPGRRGAAWPAPGPRRRSAPVEAARRGRRSRSGRARRGSRAGARGDRCSSVSSGTRSLPGKNAGRPIDPQAPSTGPATEPEPADHHDRHEQQRVVDGEEAVARDRSGRWPASSAPPRPAMPPARAKARSFVRVGRDRVGRGACRGCRARRSWCGRRRVRRSRATTTTTTARTPRTT